MHPSFRPDYCCRSLAGREELISRSHCCYAPSHDRRVAFRCHGFCRRRSPAHDEEKKVLGMQHRLESSLPTCIPNNPPHFAGPSMCTNRPHLHRHTGGEAHDGWLPQLWTGQAREAGGSVHASESDTPFPPHHFWSCPAGCMYRWDSETDMRSLA